MAGMVIFDWRQIVLDSCILHRTSHSNREIDQMRGAGVEPRPLAPLAGMITTTRPATISILDKMSHCCLSCVRAKRQWTNSASTYQEAQVRSDWVVFRRSLT